MLATFIVFVIITIYARYQDKCIIDHAANVTIRNRKEIESLKSAANDSKIEYSKLQRKCTLDIDLMSVQNKELKDNIGHLNSKAQIQKEKYNTILNENDALKAYHLLINSKERNLTRENIDLVTEVDILTQINNEISEELTNIKSHCASWVK